MSVAHRYGPVVAITGTSLMVGCGGAYSSGSLGSCGGCSFAQNADPAGVYEGSLSSATFPQGSPVVAIIAENGEGRMSVGGDAYYRLSVATAVDHLTGSFMGFSQSASLPNGGNSISGNIGGTVTANGINATFVDQTNAQQSLTLNFDNVYNQSSSLSVLAGTWSYSVSGFTLTASIQPNGAFTATDSNGCQYNGSFSLIDPNVNAYAETHVLSGCVANDTYTGLATFFPASGVGAAAVPNQIELLTDDDHGGYLVANLE
jgi:hypothetical protein